MIEGIPSYVSITFILTTFLTVGFLFYAIKQKTLDTFPAKLVVTAITFWLIFQGVLALGGFYGNTEVFPPRFPFIAGPALLFIVFLFVFFRNTFVDDLPIKLLTILHVVRIPVEIVLWWLWQNGQIPQLMTFEGRNFDILAGITAPVITWLAFRRGKLNRRLLIGWNIACLLLVTNIVVNAILSVDTPIQQFAFDQPNRAVLFFPYVWLPAIVVPIVLFAHLSSLWQLFTKFNEKT